MNKTVYLHLGFHKTGSKSVQELIRRHRERLGGSINCLLQSDAELLNLEKMCKAFDRRPSRGSRNRLTAAWTELCARIHADKTAAWLISCENLLGRIPSNRDDSKIYTNSGEIFSCVRQAEPDLDFVLCFYLRDTQRWVDSLYRHLVKTRGLAMPFPQFRALPKFSSPSTLREAAGRIAETAGLRMMTFEFESDTGTRLGPGTSLLRSIGVGDDELEAWQPIERQNVGLDRGILQHMSQPFMRRLPRVVRQVIIKGMMRASTK
jgi:hypothetical protein